MSCSACIANPAKFLATSAQHLRLQKKLPPVYDDEFLGNTLWYRHPPQKIKQSMSLISVLFRCFAASFLEDQSTSLSTFSRPPRTSSNYIQRNSKQKNRYSAYSKIYNMDP
jgi:hypothetical protein